MKFFDLVKERFRRIDERSKRSFYKIILSKNLNVLPRKGSISLVNIEFHFIYIYRWFLSREIKINAGSKIHKDGLTPPQDGNILPHFPRTFYTYRITFSPPPICASIIFTRASLIRSHRSFAV